MIKVGVIGFGKMGLLHASILNSLPDTKVTTVCERSFVIRHFAHNIIPEIALFNEVEDLIGQKLDAVYVTTPVASHFTIVETILSNNICKNIFVEKPLSMNSQKSIILCKILEKTGGIGMVGFHKRHSSIFKKAKEILSDNSLSKPVSFEAYAYSSDFCGVPNNNKSSLARGGLLRDHGSHAIDLTLWLMGEFEVLKQKGTAPGIGAVGYSVYSRVITRNGIPGEFKISSAIEGYRMPEMGLRIFGSDWSLHVNEDSITINKKNQQQMWHRQDLKEYVPFLLGDPEYTIEDQTFINAIRSKSHPNPGFEDGLLVDRAIEQIENMSI